MTGLWDDWVLLLLAGANTWCWTQPVPPPAVTQPALTHKTL